MIGSIAFTWLRGSDLDYNCKKWRLFADVANGKSKIVLSKSAFLYVISSISDFAMCLELSGPFWPSYMFQYVLCTASVSRALVGVAGGATRTAITQHQAKANNISDVAAKDGSQETLVNLAALIMNLNLLPIIAQDSQTIWTLFCLMTMLHLYANFKAVKSLIFKTLNKDRLLMVLDTYYKTTTILPPSVINVQESPFLGFGINERKFGSGFRFRLSVSIKSHLGNVLSKSYFNFIKLMKLIKPFFDNFFFRQRRKSRSTEYFRQLESKWVLFI